MEIRELKNSLNSGVTDSALAGVYGQENMETAAGRIAECADGFIDIFTDSGIFEAGRISAGDVHVFSAPGRIELCGNHTDHQNGKVIAAAVNLDIIAVAGANNENVIRIYSEGDGMSQVNLDDSLSPVEEEKGSTASIIKGTAAYLAKAGFRIGGFDAYAVSNVPKGSGLSSSAAFEVLTGQIISGLFNNGSIGGVTIAKAGKYAENEFFGKPSGLMDQLACAEGSLVYMDLKDPEDPEIRKIDADLRAAGYCVCVTDTGSSHADLTDAYAQIPSDMKTVASFFGKNVLREVTEDEMKESFGELMSRFGEGPVRRAVHFFNEEERVEDLADCLDAISRGEGNEIYVDKRKASSENEDHSSTVGAETAGKSADSNMPEEEQLTNIQQALEIICESGDSSFRFLKNVCLPGQSALDSPMAEALDMSWELLQGRGAFRVHGGGFAGTIIAVVPGDLLDGYKAAMEERFGEGACRVLDIRKTGGCMIL